MEISGLFAVVIIILAGFTLHGYTKGLIRVVFSVVSIFLTIGLVAWMTPHVSEFMETKTPIYDTIKKKCVENIQIKTKEEVGQKAEEQEPLRIAGIEIPKEFQELLQEKTADAADEMLEQNGVYEQIGDYIAGILLNIIACIISFILVVLVLRILINLLDIVAKFPVLNSVNHLGGTLAGAAEGIIMVWILFFIITLCQSSQWGQNLLDDINQNVLMKILYENNIVQYLLMHVII